MCDRKHTEKRRQTYFVTSRNHRTYAESGSGSEKKKEHHEYHCQDRFHCFNSHHLYELKIPINCVLLFTLLIILKNHFRQKGVQHDKI